MTMPAPAKDRPMKAATAPAIVQPTISDADFLKFREFFYRKTGIHFEESKRYFVDKRLIERIEATGSDSFRAYFIALRFEADGRELQQLVNLMTVNETYFFRESYLLERWRHIDDYEVETFPTLLIQRHEAVLFFGAMLPHHDLLQRTLESFHAQTPDESRHYAHADSLRRSWQNERNLRQALARRGDTPTR